MGLVTVRGVDLFYQHNPGQEGSLVFIHGSGGTHAQWAGQMELGLNCTALDLPGHGQSGGTAPDNIAENGAWVAEFLTALQLPRPLYLVGFSMGSAISLDCALNHPELLDGLILLGAGHRMKVLPALLDSLRQGLGDPNFIRMGFSAQAAPALVTQMVQEFTAAGPAVLYADFSACNDFDVSDQLERINLPTLLITGAEDRLTPLKLSQYIAEHIRGARREVIPESGHFVMMEKPAEVNQFIRDFCAQ
jgi:pimeloyl-ACP methyl ester carboxylesterase